MTVLSDVSGARIRGPGQVWVRDEEGEVDSHPLSEADRARALEVLQGCRDGHDLGPEDAAVLLLSSGVLLSELVATADQIRKVQVGEDVTYVVNRNINFTNVCVKGCRFCAFARGSNSGQGYLLEMDEVVRRAREAWEFGASEVCLQAGLAPDLRASDYLALVEAVKTALPDLHVHAYSPEEVLYGARKGGLSIRQHLRDLRAAGLDSMPGTSAEILDDRIRQRLSPERMDTQTWCDVIRTAHALEIPTTATMMFGHVESALDQARHLDLLRSVQQETGGFTEFVPLSFIPTHTRLGAPSSRPRMGPVRNGPCWSEVVRVHAVARLMLGSSIRNIQASWVKEGLDGAAELLDAGANDLGGTLINESISTSAGAAHGQLATPSDFCRVAAHRGRRARERTTLYHRREPRSGRAAAALDGVRDRDGRFGSYHDLTTAAHSRYRDSFVRRRSKGGDRP